MNPALYSTSTASHVIKPSWMLSLVESGMTTARPVAYGGTVMTTQLVIPLAFVLVFSRCSPADQGRLQL